MGAPGSAPRPQEAPVEYCARIWRPPQPSPQKRRTWRRGHHTHAASPRAPPWSWGARGSRTARRQPHPHRTRHREGGGGTRRRHALKANRAGGAPKRSGEGTASRRRRPPRRRASDETAISEPPKAESAVQSRARGRVPKRLASGGAQAQPRPVYSAGKSNSGVRAPRYVRDTPFHGSTVHLTSR